MIGIGTKVVLNHSHQTGVVVNWIDDSMVTVSMDISLDEIPIFVEDLTRADLFVMPTSSEKEPVGSVVIDSFLLKQFSKNLKVNHKIELVLLPVYSAASISKYEILLINTTESKFLIDISLLVDEDEVYGNELSISPLVCEHLTYLTADDMTYNVRFVTKTKKINYDGLSVGFDDNIRIKPKTLLTKKEIDENMGEVYKFDVLYEPSSSKSALQDYTQDLLKNKKKEVKIEFVNPIVDIRTYASFETEIDLHIELLHENPSKLNSKEIVETQLIAFEEYLQDASNIGMHKVFIIHGLGTGKLKEMISAKLRRNPFVKSFKNEYHEKYGWGATEVWFVTRK
jgi:Smr domain